MNELESKNITKQLKASKVFLATVYLPFILLLVANFNTLQYSLSSIGWRMKKTNIFYLLTYVLLTVPFLLHQGLLFLRLLGEKSTLIKFLLIAGGITLAIGAATPVSQNSPALSRYLHCRLSQLGSLMSITAVTLMVAAYCKQNKDHARKVTIWYAQFIGVTFIAFLVLFTAAIFEVGATLAFLIIIHALNRAQHKHILNRTSNEISVDLSPQPIDLSSLLNAERDFIDNALHETKEEKAL